MDNKINFEKKVKQRIVSSVLLIKEVNYFGFWLVKTCPRFSESGLMVEYW